MPKDFSPRPPSRARAEPATSVRGIIRSPAAVLLLRIVRVREKRSTSAPLQPFQLAASCRGVQAEDRRKVGRFPLRPHHSRFEQPLLVILSQCPARWWTALSGAVYRQQHAPRASPASRCAARCPVPHSALRAGASTCWTVSPDFTSGLAGPPCPVFGDPLGRDRLERFLFEVGPQLHQQLLFLGLAGRGQLQFPGRHVIVCRQSERLTRQSGRGLVQLALLRPPLSVLSLWLAPLSSPLSSRVCRNRCPLTTK